MSIFVHLDDVIFTILVYGFLGENNETYFILPYLIVKSPTLVTNNLL